MENFIFFYTLFRNFDLAMASMQNNTDFTKEFLSVAKKFCELEAQTFLNEEAKKELKKQKQILNKKIALLKNFDITPKKWRVLIGLMCTLNEWCHDTNFFNLSIEKQKFIFSENPVDGYFGN